MATDKEGDIPEWRIHLRRYGKQTYHRAERREIKKQLSDLTMLGQPNKGACQGHAEGARQCSE